MLLREDGALYNNVLYMSSEEGSEFVPDESAPLNLRNPMPLEAAVVAACILLAFAAWMILRKRGKTQWMWAILPALSLAAAGAALLLAGTSSMSKPVAAVAVNLVQDQEGNTTKMKMRTRHRRNRQRCGQYTGAAANMKPRSTRKLRGRRSVLQQYARRKTTEKWTPRSGWRTTDFTAPSATVCHSA